MVTTAAFVGVIIILIGLAQLLMSDCGYLTSKCMVCGRKYAKDKSRTCGPALVFSSDKSGLLRLYGGRATRQKVINNRDHR
jgi:hypothetical protein